MMNARAASLAAAVLAALHVAEPVRSAENTDVPAAAPAWKWTVEAVIDTVAVGNAVISPDGQTVVYTRSRWRSAEAKPGPPWANLWRVPFAGGEPERLTTADADDSRPRFSRDGRRLAFLSARSTGDAPKDGPRSRLWILPLAGGEPAALSGEKIDVAAFEWSHDGRSIAYIASDPKTEEKEKDEKAGKDARVIDGDLKPRRLWVIDVASGAAKRVSALGDLSAWDFAWSPDDKALVASVTELNRTDDSYLFKRLVVLPLEGERRELVPVVGKVGEVVWSRDGQYIAWTGGVDASDPSLGSVFVIPAAGGTARNLSAGREDTATTIAWLGDGHLAVSRAVGTRSALSLVDPASGAWQDLVAPGVVALGATSWSADGARFATIAATPAHPSNVYGGTRGEPPRRLVTSNAALEALPRGTQQVIRYPARDGVAIEAVLVQPAIIDKARRYPLLVVAHGGPESHYADAWMTFYFASAHLWAERGVVALFPNYRGSTGRGVAFAKADHKDLGGKEFTDVLDGIDFLVAKGLVDTKRVGLTGGSYGGYFTALGVTRYSERFAAGVEMFGISNWESFIGQSDIPIENSLVHWDLWCYENAKLCRERSPVAHIAKAATPTLILQGADDLRVPRAQSDELYAALKWKKVPVEYVVYPREAHGFRERWHRIDALTRAIGWMEKYLATSAAPAAVSP